MNSIQNSKLVSIFKKFPLHILLLAIFFILHSNNYYAKLIPGKDIFLAFVYTSCALALTYGISYLIFRNITNAGIATTILGIVFLFFGHFKKTLQELPIPAFISSYKFLLPALTLLLLILLFRLKKRAALTRTNFFLNLLLIIYIIIELLDVGSKKHGIIENAILNTNNKDLITARTTPDIIYILTDCYPSSSFQQELLGASPNELDSALIKAGFFVVPRSSSNYKFTTFSMASVFNLDYLPGVENAKQRQPFQYNQALYWIENAQVFKLLNTYNYDIYNLSIFDLPGKPAVQKERFLSTTGMELIFHNTLYSGLNRDVIPELFPVLRTRFIEKAQKINMQQRGRFKEYNKQMIDSLASFESRKPGQAPRFIYTHLVMPHFPYVFDSLGNPYPDKAIFGDEMITNKNRFKNYIAYTNKILIKLVTRLQEMDDRKSIIVLQSDHALDDIPGTQQKDAFRNYAAYFFPDGDYSTLRDDLSNVNTFRILFNKYFGQQLPLLADSSIYSN